MNYVAMPIYTRHSAGVAVPNVLGMSADEAQTALARQDLRAQIQEQPFNPNNPRDRVVEQNPAAETAVKPGRRVYVYVNASPRDFVRVPDIRTRDEGVARAELQAAGLQILDVREDTVYTPFEGTVSRQAPPAGSSVPEGSGITLWISPGLGDEMVSIPDVLGMTPSEARAALRAAGLFVESPGATGDSVARQDPEPNLRRRKGTEVSIFTN
jgi:beta-lactam-binding protein with PASTA domain